MEEIAKFENIRIQDKGDGFDPGPGKFMVKLTYTFETKNGDSEQKKHQKIWNIPTRRKDLLLELVNICEAMLYNEPKHYEQIPGYLNWFMSHKLVTTDSDQLTRDEFCAVPVYNEDMSLSALEDYRVFYIDDNDGYYNVTPVEGRITNPADVIANIKNRIAESGLSEKEHIFVHLTGNLKDTCLAVICEDLFGPSRVRAVSVTDNSGILRTLKIGRSKPEILSIMASLDAAGYVADVGPVADSMANLFWTIEVQDQHGAVNSKNWHELPENQRPNHAAFVDSNIMNAVPSACIRLLANALTKKGGSFCIISTELPGSDLTIDDLNLSPTALRNIARQLGISEYIIEKGLTRHDKA